MVIDEVTKAIVAGATAASGKIVGKAIEDSYNALKTIIKRKFGEDNKISQEIKNIESDPKSDGHKLVLKEEIEKVKADEDQEILNAAKTLLEQIKAEPGGQNLILQIAHGNYNATAAVHSTATVYTNRSEE